LRIRLMPARNLFADLPGTSRMWLMLGIAFLCACGFFLVADLVFDGGREVEVPFDQHVAQFLQQFRSEAFTGRVGEVSALGSAPVLAMLALLAYSVILGARDRIGFAHLSIALLGASVWSRLLQALFDRERPENLLPSIVVTEGSFPSAHTFGAAACYVTFAFFHARYAARLGAKVAGYVFALVLVVLIGVTRIYLGAHHATDVIAGICAGAAWAFLVAAIFLPWYEKRS
jgi:membrane-associated phospholipid phosphatase